MQTNINTKSGPDKQQNMHSKNMLTEKTERAWFSRLLRHPAMK